MRNKEQRNKLVRDRWANDPAFRAAMIEKQYLRFKRKYQSDPVYRAKKNKSNVLSKHGVKRHEYEAMVVAQGGTCAICKKIPSGRGFNIDHCHNTKRVRGLLCTNCNLAIGHMEDDTERLHAAIAYLQKGVQ